MSIRSELRDERGSSLFEAALVTLPFLLILFGVFEFGLLARNNLATTNAANEGARAASVFANDADADFFIMQTVAQGIAGQGTDSVDFVVVYRIANVGDPIPTGCLTSSIADVCNRYTADQAFNRPLVDPVTLAVTGNWGCDRSPVIDPPTIALDSAWCPLDRNTSLSGPPDLVGVYVQTTHDYATNFFGSTRTLQESVVIQIEPEGQ